jgi:DNA polymerase-1
LLHAGIAVRGLAFDTMIAAGLLGKTPGLKELSFYELKLTNAMTPIEELIGRGNKQITFDKVPIEQATPYAAADADMTMRLVLALQPQLAAEPRVNDIFQRLEMPLVDVLVHMEEAGIGLDVGYITQLGERLGSRIREIEQTIYGFNNGEKFNINSGDQLSELLFEKIGISAEGVGRTAKTKKYSLTAETLELIRDRHPIFEQIMLYRQLTKLKSTYVDSIPSLVDPTNGRVRTVYNQLGSATGRLSSVDPNLQNIPIRAQEGKEIRRAFVAAHGHCFIAADYSQIELRIMAHFAKDPSLIEVFEQKQDIHAATAAKLFSTEIDQVDKNQRRVAKTVVFGVLYGISAFGLSQRLHMERSAAQQLINELFARFPGIRRYIDETLERGRRDGYVSTLFGRKRRMDALRASGPQRQAAEREAINAPIQGTAADIMKIAMINVANTLKERQLKTRLLLQVHDELILEAPQEEVETAKELLCEVMENAYKLEVQVDGVKRIIPLEVGVETGTNWGEMTAL